MYYQVYCRANIATDKKWLTRHKYSKLAVKVYGYLATTKDPSDNTIATKCNVSLTMYKEAKRELVFAGLLEIVKLNASHIIYYVGDKAITAQSKAIKDKESARVARKAMESLELVPNEDEEDESIIDLTSYTNLKELTKVIPLPKPINTKGII